MQQETAVVERAPYLTYANRTALLRTQVTVWRTHLALLTPDFRYVGPAVTPQRSPRMGGSLRHACVGTTRKAIRTGQVSQTATLVSYQTRSFDANLSWVGLAGMGSVQYAETNRDTGDSGMFGWIWSLSGILVPMKGV